MVWKTWHLGADQLFLHWNMGPRTWRRGTGRSFLSLLVILTSDVDICVLAMTVDGRVHDVHKRRVDLNLRIQCHSDVIA